MLVTVAEKVLVLVPVKTEDDVDNDKRSTAAARHTSGGTLDVRLSGGRNEFRALKQFYTNVV